MEAGTGQSNLLHLKRQISGHHSRCFILAYFLCSCLVVFTSSRFPAFSIKSWEIRFITKWCSWKFFKAFAASWKYSKTPYKQWCQCNKHVFTHTTNIYLPIPHHNRKSFWTFINSERFTVSDIFNECSDCFQVHEKQRLLCYFSVNNCMPASRWHHLLKLKWKKKTLLRLSLASFSPHH